MMRLRCSVVLVLTAALWAGACSSDSDSSGGAYPAGAGGSAAGGAAASGGTAASGGADASSGGTAATGGSGGSSGGSGGSAATAGSGGSTTGGNGGTTATGGSGGSTTGGSGGVAASGGNAGADASTGSGGTGATGGSGTGGSVAQDASFDFDAPVTWWSECGSQGPPKLVGQVLAPNGNDPVPFASAYIAYDVKPIAPGVACDGCNQAADPIYVSTQTGIDGRFTLDLGSIPYGVSIQLVVRKGRFRKVSTITPNCGQTINLSKARTTLPGTTNDGDMPKIAVGSGNADHLDEVVLTLGISEFDCYEGVSDSRRDNCPNAQDSGQRVVELLKNRTLLDTYNLLFLSCAVNIFSSYSQADRSAVTSNLKGWVEAGGRLIVTDHSYDYISQAWPDAIVWHGPAGPPWEIGTLLGAGANVGLAPQNGSTYPGVISDPNLTAWLKLSEIGVNSAPNVNIGGWLRPWTVQKAVGTGTTSVVHGNVDWEYPSGSGRQTSDYPLTTQFIANSCGRVIYSSYHTDFSSALTPQERILEYLMLDVASCLPDT